MDAADVKAALLKRWPDDRYIHIPEAPLDPARMGGKIDVAVIALWRSLKLEIDAVEIKVSYSDWKNELQTYHWVVDWDADATFPLGWTDREKGSTYGTSAQARWNAERFGGKARRVTRPTMEKSQAWRDHAHRFWIACPVALAPKIQAELPAGWGLIAALDDGTTKTVVKPVTVAPENLLDWPKVIGLIRAAADAGAAAILRAETRGVRQGMDLAHARGVQLEAAQLEAAGHWDEIMVLREKLRICEAGPPPEPMSPSM